VENPAGGFDTLRQEQMTPHQALSEPWQLLHNDNPRLFPNATFNYRGNLKPEWQ
jgi:hypothetical protein